MDPVKAALYKYLHRLTHTAMDGRTLAYKHDREIYSRLLEIVEEAGQMEDYLEWELWEGGKTTC